MFASLQCAPFWAVPCLFLVPCGGLLIEETSVHALQERNLVALPLAARPGAASSLTTLQVLKRFEFDASLMRAGVMVAGSTAGGARLFVRGAPNKVQELVTSDKIPSDFHQVLCTDVTPLVDIVISMSIPQTSQCCFP